MFIFDHFWGTFFLFGFFAFFYSEIERNLLAKSKFSVVVAVCWSLGRNFRFFKNVRFARKAYFILKGSCLSCKGEGWRDEGVERSARRAPFPSNLKLLWR